MVGKSDNRFGGMMPPGMNEEARRAVASAFDAMSQWRNDMQSQGERNSTVVFDRMAAAAKAMGWPTEIVETSRTQMQAMSRMQMQMLDQVMDTWEEQLKSPNPTAAMQSMMERLTQFPVPGFGAGMSGFPGMGAMGPGGMPANPFQFWMQVGEMWQKQWTQAMQVWSQQGGPGGPRKP